MARRRKYSQLHCCCPTSIFQPTTPVTENPTLSSDNVSLATIRRQQCLRNQMSYIAFTEYTCIVLLIERGYLSVQDFKLLAATCKTLNCLITSDYIYSCSSEYRSKGMRSLMPNHIYHHKRFDSFVDKSQYYRPSKRSRNYELPKELLIGNNEEDNYLAAIYKLKNLSIYNISAYTYQINLI